MTKLIARLWHGTTRANQSDQFLDYILETGARDIRSTQGNVGLAILRSREPDIAQFWMVSTWEDMDSIRAFAGDQPEKPRYYPLDADYLLELESRSGGDSRESLTVLKLCTMDLHGMERISVISSRPPHPNRPSPHRPLLSIVSSKSSATYITGENSS